MIKKFLSPYVVIGISFFTWGFAPLYWNTFNEIPVAHLLSYCVFSSLIILFIIFAFKTKFKIRTTLRQIPKTSIIIYAFAGALIGLNWIAFMYSAHINRGVEASLGYFMIPFVYLIISFYVYKENKENIKQISMGLVIFASIILLFSEKIIYWIPLSIAICFGLYGHIKKLGKLDITTGLFIETCAIAVVCFLYALYDFSIVTRLSHYSLTTIYMIIGSGVFSLVPLYCYCYAIKNLDINNIGWIQYIAPLSQLVIGLVVFKNSIDQITAVSLMMIWSAIIVIIINRQLKLIESK